EVKAARQALEALLARDARSVEAWVVLAELELQVGSGNSATTAWRRAKELERSARTSFGLARARLAANDVPIAEKLARETLTLEPTHAGAKLLLAQVTWEREEGEESIEQLKQVIEQKH